MDDVGREGVPRVVGQGGHGRVYMYQYWGTASLGLVARLTLEPGAWALEPVIRQSEHNPSIMSQ